MNINSFWSKVDAYGDCWIWTGAKSRGGKNTYYGNLRFNGRYRKAHIVSWENLVGKIPNNYKLDHLCRNGLCVNPDHLEPVTHKVNCIRGIAGVINSNRKRSKTHCPRGHEYNHNNTYIRKNGRRECKVCAKGLRRGEYEGWVS